MSGHRRPKDGVASARLCPGHPRLPLLRQENRTWMAGTSPAMTATNAFPPFWASPANSQWPACFPALLAPNRDREIGGGRATRQPGQVRKEAALTRSGSGRSSVSYLFFERIAQGGRQGPRLAPDFVPFRKPAPRDNQLRIDR